MKCCYLLILIGLFTGQAASAQEVQTNDRGEKIIVYPDGSWKFYEGSDLEPDPTEGMTAEEREDYLDEESRKEAIRVAERARAEANRLERAFRELRMARSLAERALNETDPISPSGVEEAKNELDRAIEAQKLAEERYEEAEKYAEKVADLIYKPRRKRQKKMAKLLAKREDWRRRNDPDYVTPAVITGNFEDTPETEPLPTRPTEATSPHTDPKERVYEKYDPRKDVLINPPTPTCELTVDGTDEFTQVSRRATKPTLLFSHTNEELRDVFDAEDDYITAYGHLLQVEGGQRYLVLDFYIASQQAERAFGALRPNSMVTLRFLDGETFSLFNVKYDRGKYDAVTGRYRFRGQYSVAGRVEKQLTKSELDQVRVVWETGYEDYPIYELDFFRDQFECLNP